MPSASDSPQDPPPSFTASFGCSLIALDLSHIVAPKTEPGAAFSEPEAALDIEFPSYKKRGDAKPFHGSMEKKKPVTLMLCPTQRQDHGTGGQKHTGTPLSLTDRQSHFPLPSNPWTCYPCLSRSGLDEPMDLLNSWGGRSWVTGHSQGAP